MQHLAPVADPAFQYQSTPYLGSLCRFDGGDFEHFPERTGWKLQEDEKQVTALLLREDGLPVVDEVLTAFLQAWLFFGLASDFLRTFGIEVDEEDFVKPAALGNQITTISLPDYLKRVQDIEANESIKAQKTHLEKSLKLLHHAGDLVDEFLSFPVLRYQSDEPTQQKLVIAESIALLGDSLMNAAKNIWAHLEDDLRRLEEPRMRKRLRYCEPATLSLKRLEHLGWCKSDRSMMHRLVDSTGLFYIAQLKRATMPTKHARCSMYECLEMQIDARTYRSQHTSKACSCPVISVDVAEIINIIEDDMIPCVTVNTKTAGDGSSAVSVNQDSKVA
ncbi:hypothetical protein PV11_03663 [Exophiala sideris]|uniref:Uncharacterized protein n=1 Tax=Exophiala sideris TaxID=1016849 RepID=A0A0D1Z3P6_9EURO|nr:hypothetical protein PV11_03663 [Exophiala sideris]